MEQQAKGAAYQIQVIDRAVAVLDSLAASSEPQTLTKICKRLRLNKSTLSRIMAVLEHHRFVSRSGPGGSYRLGMKLFELGSRALGRLDLEQRVRGRLERLVAMLGETAYLSVLDGAEMLVVARAESPRAVRAPATIGRRHPLHCSAVGKALLACLPEEEVRGLIGETKLQVFTANTIADADALLDELQGVRSRGWAMDDEEIEEGLRCIAAPVMSHSGRPLAALGILAPAFRIPDERVNEVVAAVVREADEFSAELGFPERTGRLESGGPAISSA